MKILKLEVKAWSALAGFILFSLTIHLQVVVIKMSYYAGKIFEFETFEEADKKFNELINKYLDDRVTLIRSDHWASKGFWVELGNVNLSEFDFVLKKYNKHEEII